MMANPRLGGFFLVGSLLILGAGSAPAQLHPSVLPPLTPDAHFPRCSAMELVEIGFPDHKHAFTWYGWEVLKDEQGRPYGPGAFCRHKELIPRPDLHIEPDRKVFGQFVLEHNVAYSDCDMLYFMELVDWAWHEVPALIGLSSSDTLTMVNPDNNEAYGRLTGYGIWRLYLLEDDRAIMQPWPVLQGRTLDGHAAFMLVTDWLLRENLGDALPPWLHQGLVEYCGEHGQHLVNYMAQFRKEGSVLMSPPLVDALLSRGPDPDPQTDREVYRKACYSAFLMVWELVENRGGLQAMREYLDQVSTGRTPDDAAVDVYGLDMAELAASLDPVRLGEPGGKNPPLPVPHKQP